MRKASEKDMRANSPSFYPHSELPSNSSSHSDVQAQHEVFVDAMLQMIAEDMLPLNISEGSGFRNLMTLIGPQYPQLSQRTIGLQLYNAVEKALKPRMIQDLKNCVSLNGGQNVHLTADIWAGEYAEPLLVVRVHFLDDDWNIHRPTIAFRNLQCKKLMTNIEGELESVLLSFGLFPHDIGYTTIHEAKNTIATHNVFCDYKNMCSAQNDPNEVLDFLEDQVVIDDYSLIEMSSSKRMDCITTLLHCVVKEALKKSSDVEQMLFELQSVVSFFWRSTYWSDVLEKKCRLSLTNPYTWNSTIIFIRKMMHESVWPLVMSVLNQAHAGAKDCTICPPVVQVTREQVVDFVGLLEPFEEAVQVLQEDDITLSLIIPSIIGLDKTLETKSTKLSYFCSALRSGLRTYFQPLIFQRDLIVASVLDHESSSNPSLLDRKNSGAPHFSLLPKSVPVQL